MLKIVEVHPSPNPQGEYVVLHNLGLVTESLRGCALSTDAYLEGNIKNVGAFMYVFRQDIPIKPYMRVVVFTGCGEDGWMPTTDGKQAYCAYWGRPQSVWHGAENVHILQIAASKRIVQPGTQTNSLTARSAAQDISRQADSERQESYASVSEREAVR